MKGIPPYPELYDTMTVSRSYSFGVLCARVPQSDKAHESAAGYDSGNMTKHHKEVPD